MSTNDNRTAAAVRSDDPPRPRTGAAGDPSQAPAVTGMNAHARRRFGAVTALRAIAATALATTAALGTAAPVLAQSASGTTSSTTQTGHLWVWVSDGFGGGAVTSSPAGINCHQAPGTDVFGTNPQPGPTGACDATYPVGTHVALTAIAAPGSYINYWDPPSAACNYHSYSCTTTVVIVQGYNAADFMFCPENDICSDG